MKLSDYPPFEEHRKTLREISSDNTNNQTLTDSELLAVSFDEAKIFYIRQITPGESGPKSVDALLQIEDAVALIEFKNCNVHKKRQEIRLKISDSLLMLSGIYDLTLSALREQTIFILVYSKEKNKPSESQSTEARDFIHKYISAKAHEEPVRFSLKMLEKLYLREVHTFTPEEFELYLTEHFPS